MFTTPLLPKGTSLTFTTHAGRKRNFADIHNAAAVKRNFADVHDAALLTIRVNVRNQDRQSPLSR